MCSIAAGLKCGHLLSRQQLVVVPVSEAVEGESHGCQVAASCWREHRPPAWQVNCSADGVRLASWLA